MLKANIQFKPNKRAKYNKYKKNIAYLRNLGNEVITKRLNQLNKEDNNDKDILSIIFSNWSKWFIFENYFY